MNNLGLYQWITKAAKKCGGPGLFFFGVMAVGYTVFRTAEGTIKLVLKDSKKKKETMIFNVIKYGKSNEGIEFEEGMQFRVLEEHNNAILIEIIGDVNNPYFADRELLNKISNFK